jgi:hypothetical protein
MAEAMAPNASSLARVDAWDSTRAAARLSSASSRIADLSMSLDIPYY